MHEHASLNRIFRLVWSAAQGCWVAVHEHARGRSKAGRSGRRLRALVTALVLGAGGAAAQAAPPAANALPQGGQVVAGQATLQQQGASLVVNQTTARTAIDWTSFDIGQNASVAFRQPDSSSVALNRVTGSAPSRIFGRLTANGQVFLTNASGIYFAPTAQVDVGSFVASTNSLSLADFMAGKLVFERAGSTASVENDGRITAANGGYVALLAPEVRNGGVVVAQAGTVALAAGEAIELQFDGGSLASVRVTPADIATLIDNRHAVLAPGGQILLSARAAQALQGSVIRNSGELSASSLVAKGGRIVLEADHIDIAAGSAITATGATGGGQINVGGSYQGQGELYNATTTTIASGASLDASATANGDGGSVVVWSNDRTRFDGSIAARGGALGGNGGLVETSGKKVLSVRTGVADVSARKGKGGIWLLDPNDITIGAVADTNVNGSFGTTDDDAFLSTGSLAAALTNGSNVTVLTNNAGTNAGLGDITVTGAITTALAAAQSATLTLAAQGSINFTAGGSITSGGADRSLNVNLHAGTALGGGSPGTVASEVTMAVGSTINTGLAGNLAAIAKGDVTLAGLTVGGTLSATTNNGAFAQVGAATIGGSATINAGTGEVALNNASNQLTGAVSSTGTGAVTIRNGLATVLGAISASTLDVITANAAVTQTGAASVTGETTIAAGTGSVTLNNAANQLTGAVNSTGSGALTLRNDIATNLGTIGTSGGPAASLSVTTSNDNVSQSGTSYVTGAATVAAGTGSVLLTNTGNQLSGAVSSTGTGAVTLRNAVSTNLGAIGSAGNGAASLTVRNSNGSITQSGAAVVAGATSLRTDTGGAITANNASNQFTGAVTTVGTGAVTLVNTGATVLGQIGSSGSRATSLSVSTNGGAVSQSGTAFVDGTTTVSAGAGAVTLDNASNKLNGAVSSVGTGAVTVANSQAVALGQIGASGGGNAAASLTVTTINDAVTQSASAYVAGATTVNAGSAAVTLNDAGNQLAGAVGSTGRGDVTLVNTVATVLGPIGASGAGNAAASLTVTATNQNLSQTGAALVDGATTVNGGSGAVALTNAGNALVGAVTVNNTGSASVASTGALGITFNGSGTTSAAAGAALTATLSGTGATTLSGQGVTLSGTAASLASSSTGATSVGVTTVAGNATLDSSGATTQSGALTAAGLELKGNGAVTLTNAGNSITTLAAASGSGDVVVANSGALAIGTVNSVGITRSGTVAVSTAAGDLTLNQSVATTSTASNAVVLNAASSAAAGTGAGGNVIVNGGSTVSVGSGGQATLYSGTVAGSTGLTALVGSGSGRFRYGSDESASNFTAALGAGVNAVYRESPTVTITADNLTRTYGTATAATTSLAGQQNGDTAGQIFSTAPTVAVGGTLSTSSNPVVGAHTLTASGAVDSRGYTLAYAAPGALTVNAATISDISGITAANKVYDTTAAATLSTGSAGFTGIVSGDVLTVATSTGNFTDKNVANGKTVNITGLTLGGADAGNYTLASSTASTTANITPATISAITGITAGNKVYDGNTTAALTTAGAAFTGMLGGDVLNVATSTGNFVDKNVANGKTVNITGLTLGGTDAGNYTLASSTASTTANITAATIAGITGITAANKVYDGNANATLGTGSAGFTGMVSGDVLTVATGSGTFNDKNVANGKTVSIAGLTLGGADAGNYTLASSTASTTANVTPATISAITGITAANKVYDTTTAATLSTGSAAFNGMVGGDTLTVVTSTGNFVDKNVANGKTVNITALTLGGADAGNYTLASSTASTTADITPVTISAITGITAANKVYDGNATAALTTSGAGFTGMLGGDVLNVATSTGAFNDKNVANGKTVNITGLTLGGADAGNYTLASTTASTTANVTAATISAITGITAANKVYDTTTAATLSTGSAGFTGMVGGDALTVATSSGAFVDKNVANGKTVNITGLTLGGADAGNYTLSSSTASTTANITPVTISAITGITAANKVYDGNATAALTTTGAGFTGMLGGDVLNVATSTGNFVDKNVANGKTVNITGLTLGGTDAGNYTLASSVASTTANITAATVSAITGITAANKVYDGNANATLGTGSAGFTGMVSGDVLTVATGSGTFSDKNVANGKTVSIAGLTLGGADAGNYTLSSGTASATADVTPATISAITGITAANKLYDTTTAATLSTGAAGFTGMVGGDTLTVATSTGNFVDKNVANGKTVNITALTLGGADAGNYTLASSTASTTANITPVTVSAITGITAASKVYDGNATAALTTSGAGFTGMLGGDVLNVATSTGAFNDKNVANGKTVSITGLTLGGTDAGNYTLASTTASTTANITPASISAVTGITAANKVYDTTAAATLTTSGAGFTGMVAGDVLTVATSSGAFSDKNVANGKTVNITGLTLGGADVGNYTLASSTATTTADITPASISAITGITAANKVYNGNTTATLTTTGAGFTGILAGDVLNVATSTGNFTDKNVANGKTVNITALTLGGSDAGNYTLASNTASTTANITPASISAITGITAANKVYDTTTAATLGTGSAAFTGMVAGDALTVATGSGSFADKNVANGKTVSIAGLTLGGTDAGNYTLASSTASATANITPATISAVTGITAANKVYDANTTATLTTSGAGFTGVLAGDVLNVATSTGNFSDKNVANGKTVNITALTLGGTDAGNYTLSSNTASTTANITPATVSAITGITAANKVYNGNTTATLGTSAAGFTGMVAGDVLNVATGSGSFADKNVANGKTVSIAGLTLGGTDAGNYTLSSSTASTTANITPASITAVTGITAASKVYDTTTAATLTTSGAGFTGMVAGDALTVVTATGNFVDKNVANGKTVSIAGLTLGGADAGNYGLASATATTTANITPVTIAAITGITAVDKVYNGNTTAALVTSGAGFTGMLAGDVLNVATSTGNFSDKNVANGKTVSITALTLGGSDAGNYTLASNTASTTANITPASISAITGITAANKVYDTTTAATLTTSGAGFTGKVAGDVLNVATSTGNFSDKNAATGKTVNITALTLGGTDAGNYTLASSTATTTASISKAALTAVNGITAANRVYDATTVASTNSSAATLTGVLAGDTVNVASATGSFANKNVGTAKTVTVAVTLGGTDAGNYSLPATTTTADISRATLSQVSGIAAMNKVEDGNAVATLVTDAAVFNGKFDGDVLTVAQASGQFDNAHPGLGKPVAISGIAVGGTDAGNYTLASTTATTTAAIYARPPVLSTFFNAPTLPSAPGSSSATLDLGHAVLVAGAPSSLAAAGTAMATGELDVQVLREPSAMRGGDYRLTVPRAMVGRDFAFTLPITLRGAIVAAAGTVRVQQADGRPVPGWLRYDAAAMRFVATALPADALPLRLSINLGNHQTAELLIDMR